MNRIRQTILSIPGLLALGTSATVAVLTHSWAVGLVGVLACGALAALERGKEKKPLPPTELADVRRIRDPYTAAAVTAIFAARSELERTLADTPASLATDLAPMFGQVADLDRQAAKLVKRAEDIAAHLAKSDVAALQRDVDGLTARLEHTTDATAKAHYAAARNTRAGHVATLRELALVKERIGATLLSIAANLDAVAAKVVRLRGLDGLAADATGDVRRDLETMNEELASFESTLLELSSER